MKYAVIYLKSEWSQPLSEDVTNRGKIKGNSCDTILSLPKGVSPAGLVTMPPYGATIAGNVLHKLKQEDFIGVFDEYMLHADIEDMIKDIYISNKHESLTLFFSVYVFNNDRTIKIIEWIKICFKDILVVIGGPFAEYFICNKNVDSVIIGDAETGIREYLEKKSKLIFAEKANPNEFQIDFTVIKKDREYEEGVINSMRGCKYRTSESKGCVFCSMKEYTLRLRDPELILKEMAREAEDLSTVWFFDGSDSFVASKKWLKKFSTIRSKLISDGYEILEKLKIYAYVNPSDVIDKEVTDLLYHCGIRKVFLGIESGDSTVLVTMSKPKASVEFNRRALKLFEGSNIELRLGIVIGIGEDENTLLNTYNFLKDLKQHKELKVVSVVLSPVLVLPGSKLYQNLISNKYKMKGQDLLIIQEINDQLKQGNGITKNFINIISRIYHETNNNISYEKLLVWIDKMNEMLIKQNIGIWVFDGFNK
ncbi:MAG: radical SAM protein [Bacteroidetes bacterium]|nr:radical SAM protein [Bacteroidota bacterium]